MKNRGRGPVGLGLLDASEDQTRANKELKAKGEPAP